MNVIFDHNLGEKKWDEFVKANSSDFGLIQSWIWGEFCQSLGRKIFRLAVAEDEKILAVAQVIIMPLKFGRSYFYAPRSPVIMKTLEHENIKIEILECLFDEIKKLAQKEKAIFLRFEPTDQENKKSRKQKNKLRFVGQVQPKKTLILDLTQSEEEILKQMKSKTRYNIKVAEKHKIEIDEGERYFGDFWRLIGKTSVRQEIKPHRESYYAQMLAVLGRKGHLKLMVAKSEGRVIAANLVAFFGSWCVYLHGASDYGHRDKMAPFLLQWATIKQAKKSGYLFYDFWGVDEKKWPGVTRFKIGFAPAVLPVEYVGAWDEVYAGFWYNLYRIMKTIKH